MSNPIQRLLPHALLFPTLTVASCLVSGAAWADSFTVSRSFCTETNCIDGGYPAAGVTPLGNYLIGTAQKGGAYGFGGVYVLNPQGSYALAYSFCPSTGCADGAFPSGGLALGSDGLYGTTYGGGANGGGTVFRFTASGGLTTLYSFCAQDGCTDGKFPLGSLVVGTDGNIYGTTSLGGAKGYGTAFRITPATGALTTLYSFCTASLCADGGSPNGAIVANDGNLYGTTFNGGASDNGTVFKLTPGGILTTLYSFCTSSSSCTDGAVPYADLVQVGGALVGTTRGGGANSAGTVFSITPTLQSSLATLYSFCTQANCVDGQSPESNLVSLGGRLYGTTFAGGTANYGTVFSLSGTRTFSTVYNFCAQTNCTDGASPASGLAAGRDGALYGTTPAGGANQTGALFRLSPGS